MVFAPCGYDCRRAAVAGRSLLDSDEWSWARHSSCWAIDGNALTSRPGLRLVQGVETLAALLHPSLFAPPDERWAERLTASG
jgi:iron complex transport system substrate-binding protein